MSEWIFRFSSKPCSRYTCFPSADIHAANEIICSHIHQDSIMLCYLLRILIKQISIFWKCWIYEWSNKMNCSHTYIHTHSHMSSKSDILTEIIKCLKSEPECVDFFVSLSLPSSCTRSYRWVSAIVFFWHRFNENVSSKKKNVFQNQTYLNRNLSWAREKAAARDRYRALYSWMPYWARESVL